MSEPLTPLALRKALKELVVQVGDFDFDPDTIADDEGLIGERLDLNSLDAIEIAASVDYAYDVRIEDVRGARQIMRSINTLAAHIAREKGWEIS